MIRRPRGARVLDRRTRLTALLSVSVLTAATVTAVQFATASPASPANAAGPTKPPSAAPTPTPAQTAAATARRTGRPVEVADQTTERSQVLAQPDGTFELIATRQPTRVRQHGAWTPIDTTLRVGPDGTVAPAATLQDVAFSGGGRGPLVTVRDGARRVSLSWPNPLPAPTLNGDTANYAGVLPGVDLQVIAGDASYREVLVVHDATAARNPALRTLHLDVTTQGVTLAGQPDGGLVATDAAGTAVFRGSPPVMWDSSRGGTAHQIAGGKVSNLGVGLRGGRLTLTPPAAALVGPDVTYPVYVDPAIGPSALPYLTVQSGGWDYYDDTSEPMRVGKCDWPECTSRNGIARSYLSFNTAALDGPSGVTAHIFSAQVSVTQVYGASCASQPVALWSAGAFTSATNWPGPAIDGLQSLSSDGGACGNGAAKSLLFNGSGVMTWMQTSATNNYQSTNFLLRAPDESERLQWKKFGNKATLEVHYDFPPATPTALSVDSSVACSGHPRYVRDRTPVLHAKGNTYAGTKAALWYEVAIGGNRVRYNTDIGVTGDSGTLQAWATNSPTTNNTAPLTDGAHLWRVQAESWMFGDSRDLRSGWTAWTDNGFTIDATPPATPSVASFDYPANYWGAPSNAPGQFTFSGGGDTAAFTYSFDRAGGETLPTDTTCTYGGKSTTGGTVVPSSGRVTFPVASGLSPGFHTLYVKAFDPAHNVSAESLPYVFYVSPTVLDEGATQWEGEGLTVTQPIGQGDPTYNNGAGYPVFAAPNASSSNGALAQLAASAPNARFDFHFATPSSLDAYDALGAQLSTTNHSGKVQFYLDGGSTPLSVNGQNLFNLYSPNPGSTYVQLGGARLKPGQHTLTVAVAEKDPSSVSGLYNGTYGGITLTNYNDNGYSAGVDFFTVVPIKNVTSSSFLASFNNDGIAADGVVGDPPAIEPSLPNIGFSEQAMTAKGFGPGQTPTVDGVPFPMPQVATWSYDNTLSYGQTVMLPAGSDGQYPQAKTVELLLASTCHATPRPSPASQLTMNFQNPGDPDHPLTSDQMLPAVGLWTDPAAGPVAPSDNTGGVTPAATFDYVDSNRAKDTTRQATIYHVTFLVPALRIGSRLSSVTLPDLGSAFTKSCVQPNLHVLALTTTV